MVIFVCVLGWAEVPVFGQTAPVTPKITADAARCFQIDQQISDLTAQMRSGALTAAVRKQRADALTAERTKIVAGYGARTTPEHRALLAEIARLKADATAAERAERAEATRLAREKSAAEQAARREDAKAERQRAERAAADALEADVTAVVNQQLMLERDRFYADMGVTVSTDRLGDERTNSGAQAARARHAAGTGKLAPAFERKVTDTVRQRLPGERKQWFVAALPSPDSVVSPFSSPLERAAALTAAERLLEFHVSLPRSSEATAKLEAYRTARNQLGVERSAFSPLADDRAFQARVFAQSLPHHSQRLVADLKREQAQFRSAVAYGIGALVYLTLFLWLPIRWGRRSVVSAKEIKQAPPPSPELPSDLQWVELPGMRYPVQLTSGLVFDKEVWTETRVTTTTTTTPAPSGSPYAPPHTSTSRHVSSTVYHRYWIVTPKGEQLSQRYTDSEFLATPGQRVSSLECGNVRFLAYNHESRVIAFPPEWTKGFHRPRYWPQVGGLIVLGVVAASVSGLASAWAMGFGGVPPAYLAGPLVGASTVGSLFFSLVYVAIVNSVITGRRQRHFRNVLVPRYQAFLATHSPIIPPSVQTSNKKES